MNTVYMKVTPPAVHAALGISFFSCPDMCKDPQMTLARVQKRAAGLGVLFTYELIDVMDYHAVNGARAWALAVAGDVTADQIFRTRLVKAGVIIKAYDEVQFAFAEGSTTNVLALTDKIAVYIDIVTGAVHVLQLPVPVTAYHGPVGHPRQDEHGPDGVVPDDL